MNIQTCLFRLIIIVNIFSIIGCQSNDKKFYPYDFDIETYQKLPNAKKVILVPTQLFNPQHKGRNDKYSALDLTIKSYLEKEGFEVFTPNQIVELWNDNKLLEGGFYDQETGEIVSSRVIKAIEKTITHLKKKAGISLVIIPNIQYHTIELSKNSLNKAVWDGVSREVDSSYVSGARWMEHRAMSLLINVIADDFLNPVFRGKGGVGFITENVEKGGVSFRGKKTFDNVPEDNILEAIEIAFYPFIRSAVVEKTLPDSYYKVLYRKIGYFMSYPVSAKKQKLKDKVIVQFKVLPSGKVKDIKIVKPSKYEVFNTEAISSIQAASPFPPPPVSHFKKGATVKLPLIFKPSS